MNFAVCITRTCTSTKFIYQQALSTLLLALLVSGILYVPDSVAGSVYKWVDKQGNVHFSQTPPAENSKEYNLQYGKAKEKAPEVTKKGDDKKTPDAADKTKSDAPSAPVTPQEKLKALEKARLDAEKEKAEKLKEAAAKQEKCQKSQDHLRNVQQAGRTYDIDKSGERHYWDDATRQEKANEAQANVDKWCN